MLAICFITAYTLFTGLVILKIQWRCEGQALEKKCRFHKLDVELNDPLPQ